MAKQLPPLEIRPSQGGRLMAGLSKEAAGLENYIVKRDIRRYLDREIRAEGYDGFALNNVDLAATSQMYLPGNTDPLTVIAEARRGDGKKTIICGSKTKLFAYTGTEDTHYALNDSSQQPDYFANDTGTYVDETQYGWIQIASNLSANGRRWEAVQVGNYIVLNNGVDLPLTYRPGDSVALPIYELREQQVASVSTIASHSSNLLVIGITLINDAEFKALMAPSPSNIPVSVNSAGVMSGSVTANFNGFKLSPPVGLTVFWPSGQTCKIIKVVSGIMYTDAPAAIAAAMVHIENPASYQAYTNTSFTQSFPWRILPSMSGNPRRFGAIIPVSGTFNDRQINFEYPIRSLPELVAYNNAGASGTVSTIGGATDVVITYAGLAGATLQTSVSFVSPGIAFSCWLNNPLLNTIYSSDPTTTGNGLVSNLEAADSANSYAGTYIDLIDDGSAILKAMPLRDQIVVYKETAVIFIGAFTGDNTNPYQFGNPIRLANQGQGLRYRNCIIETGGGYYGSAHIYAGRNAFYRFDLFTQTPTEIPELQTAQDIFFSRAVIDPENAWAAENPLTREWFFSWPQQTNDTDGALCYDYAFKTCRTTGMVMYSGGKVQHPTRGDWLFLFGSNGKGAIQPVGGAPSNQGYAICRYGLYDAQVEAPSLMYVTLSGTTATASGDYWTPDHVGKTLQLGTGDFIAITAYISSTQVTFVGSAPNTTAMTTFRVLPGIWHWMGVAYDSQYETGLGDLGSADTDKQVTAYALLPSSESPKCPLSLAFKAAVNPTLSPTFPITTTLPNPNGGNLVEPTYIANYVGVRVTISAMNNPYEFVKQIWRSLVIASRSISRL